MGFIVILMRRVIVRTSLNLVNAPVGTTALTVLGLELSMPVRPVRSTMGAVLRWVSSARPAHLDCIVVRVD